MKFHERRLARALRTRNKKIKNRTRKKNANGGKRDSAARKVNEKKIAENKKKSLFSLRPVLSCLHENEIRLAHADTSNPAAALRGDVRRAKGQVPQRGLRRAQGDF